jgi:hypothetical protein
MSKKLRFIWIDDDPERQGHSDELQKRLRIKVEFVNLKRKDIFKELQILVTQSEFPDLIIIDHKLNDVKKGGFETGSTAAEVIREKWSECPIVCATAVPLSDNSIDFHKLSNYEDIFDISNISHYDSTIVSLAEAFRKMRSNPPKCTDELLRLLRVPKEDKNRLLDILPNNLKNLDFYKNKSLLMSISHWVKRTLIAKPGFLYDRLWAATLVGIKAESFSKVETVFERAKYTGVFADKINERWWQTKLREIIFSEIDDSDAIYPWALGRKLSGINQEDFSKCYSSQEDYPEIVAYTDITAKNRKQMKIRYTIPHPGFEKSLYFEEMRMMRGPVD